MKSQLSTSFNQIYIQINTKDSFTKLWLNKLDSTPNQPVNSQFKLIMTLKYKAFSLTLSRVTLQIVDYGNL